MYNPALREYEDLIPIVNPSVSYENNLLYDRDGLNIYLGEFYVNCNEGVFKNITIYYNGNISISRAFSEYSHMNYRIRHFRKKRIILISNPDRVEMRENILFRYKGLLNYIRNITISSYGKKTISPSFKPYNIHNIPIGKNNTTFATNTIKIKEPIATYNEEVRRTKKELNPIISSKLPRNYNFMNLDDSIKKCGNCVHYIYENSSLSVGLCDFWKAQVGNQNICDSIKLKKGLNNVI